LPELVFKGVQDPVVQVIAEATGEILYTVRAKSGRFQPAVYALGSYTIRLGKDKPDGISLKSILASQKDTAGTREIQI
jgi:hypothetical protein